MISAPTSELVLSIGKLIKTNNEVGISTFRFKCV